MTFLDDIKWRITRHSVDGHVSGLEALTTGCMVNQKANGIDQHLHYGRQ